MAGILLQISQPKHSRAARRTGIVDEAEGDPHLHSTGTWCGRCRLPPTHPAIPHGSLSPHDFNTLHSVKTRLRKSIALPTQSMRLFRPLVLSRVSAALR